MSITGTGTIDDPYVVTTWDELGLKGSEGTQQTAVYVKLGNDIDILDEYPDGDVPYITISSHVDGDGKSIKNLYSTEVGQNAIIRVSYGSLSNVKIKNIYSYQTVLSTSNIGSDRRSAFTDCEFSGVCKELFYKASGYATAFTRCSFNINGTSSLTSSTYPPLFVSCFIRFKSTATQIFMFSNTSSSTMQMMNASYLEAEMPNMLAITLNSSGTTTNDTRVYIDNSVLDITTDSEFTVGCASGTRATSILRSAHGHDIVAANNVVAVDETHWLDADYLSSIGFSIEVAA